MRVVRAQVWSKCTSDGHPRTEENRRGVGLDAEIDDQDILGGVARRVLRYELIQQSAFADTFHNHTWEAYMFTRASVRGIVAPQDERNVMRNDETLSVLSTLGKGNEGDFLFLSNVGCGSAPPRLLAKT